MMLSDQALTEIDREIAKYPPDRKQSAVMAALTIAQREQGWIGEELMGYLARLLEMQPIQVAEVATFYSMYELAPVGRHKISVCTNISCTLRGCLDLVAHLRETLGIAPGETTPDGKFTLREVECLAACAGAPMMQIDEDYFENLTPAKVDAILAELE